MDILGGSIFCVDTLHNHDENNRHKPTALFAQNKKSRLPLQSRLLIFVKSPFAGLCAHKR